MSYAEMDAVLDATSRLFDERSWQQNVILAARLQMGLDARSDRLSPDPPQRKTKRDYDAFAFKDHGHNMTLAEYAQQQLGLNARSDGLSPEQPRRGRQAYCEDDDSLFFDPGENEITLANRPASELDELELLRADNRAGYQGVRISSSKTKPFQAWVKRDGKKVHLGLFATAEEAARCYAGTPEGKSAVAAANAAAEEAPPLTAEEALRQAQAEGLTLLRSDNQAGFHSVRRTGSITKPYRAEVQRDGKKVHLGLFASAEEAALCYARTPEGKAAAAAAAAPPPLTAEEARQQAVEEGLTLQRSDSQTGYKGVGISSSLTSKPYVAHVWRNGRDAHLGRFATAEEAALAYARSPEGRLSSAGFY